MRLLIQHGRLVDPASNRDELADLLIEEGRVRRVAPPDTIPLQDAEYLDAGGFLVVPGLIDMHVHLREPGQEQKEDIDSGARAATAGGFATVVAMANTNPAVDDAARVRRVRDRGLEVGLCRVLPVGAVTVGREGRALAPFAEMRDAGVVALSDDGSPIIDARVMRDALVEAAALDLPILVHADEPTLSAQGQMHEGAISSRLSLRGIPAVAEEIAVARDLLLAASVGGRLHVQHLSTAGAVELAREAKAREVWVTAEVTPHHFTLNHEAVARHGTNAKMSPPLREEQDRLALIAGLRDGTIDAIATDHAPHAPSEKEAPFAQAPNGIIGAQTALPLALDLWRNGTMSLAAVIARLTSGPAGVLGLPCGTLTEGAVADVTLIDPDARWTLDADSNLSKSRNSPWWGVPLRGRAEATIVGGKVVYRRGRNPVWCRSQGSGR